MRTAIRYFSGTGNTAWLVDRLKEALESRGIPVSTGLIGIDDDPRIDEGTLSLTLCFPVYALDAPPLVQRWVERIPPGDGRTAIVIRSPGDPFFNGGTTRTMRRLLERRGWRVTIERMIVMPPNVFYRASDDLAALLLAAARRRIEQLADDIKDNRELLEKSGNAVHWSSHAFNSLLARHGHRFGRDLRATAACTRCGLCVRECPAGTITMTDEGIRFGDRCQVCLRCMARCPARAIFPLVYRSFPVRPYDLAALDAAGPEGKKPRNWFERRYRRYLRTV